MSVGRFLEEGQASASTGTCVVEAACSPEDDHWPQPWCQVTCSMVGLPRLCAGRCQLTGTVLVCQAAEGSCASPVGHVAVDDAQPRATSRWRTFPPNLTVRRLLRAAGSTKTSAASAAIRCRRGACRPRSPLFLTIGDDFASLASMTVEGASCVHEAGAPHQGMRRSTS
jgi:hypothetical protein